MEDKVETITSITPLGEHVLIERVLRFNKLILAQPDNIKPEDATVVSFKICKVSNTIEDGSMYIGREPIVATNLDVLINHGGAKVVDDPKNDKSIRAFMVKHKGEKVHMPHTPVPRDMDGKPLIDSKSRYVEFTDYVLLNVNHIMGLE